MAFTEFRPELDYAKHALEVCLTARRSLRVLSRDLDRDVYEHADLLAAVSGLARQRGAEIKIIVCDVKPIVETRHRLLA